MPRDGASRARMRSGGLSSSLEQHVRENDGEHGYLYLTTIICATKPSNFRFAPCQSTEFSFIYQSMVWSVGSSLDVQNNFMWKSCFRAHVATSSAHLAVIGSICARPIFWPCHQGVWSISASFSSPNEGSEALGRFSSSSAIHLSRRCKHLLVCGIEVPISSLNLFD